MRSKALAGGVFWRSDTSASRLSGPLAAWLVPVALVLLTIAVRLPFARQFDDDEAFYSIVATRWLAGELPYAASFDIKPPLLFAIYAAVQALFGASLAVLKGIEIGFVALGAVLLFRLVRRWGTPGAALWAGCLYPVYSLSLQGTYAAATLILLPFVILAFDMALAALDRGDVAAMARAFLAGLSIGAAGMIKQTAIIEALAIAGLLAFAGATAGEGIRRLVAFGMGAAVLPLGFAAYFTSTGHFGEFFDAVVLSAAGRTGAGDAVFVEGGARLDFLDGAFRIMPLTKALYLLLACALLAATRLQAIKTIFPSRLLGVAALWLAASALGIIAARSMAEFYALSLVPPLLILSGAFVAHGLVVQGQRRGVVVAALALAAIAVPAFFSRESLASGNSDVLAAQRAAARIEALSPGRTDRLVAIDRGQLVNVITGLMPAIRAFHTLQFFCGLPSPLSDPLLAAIQSAPRFLVIADERIAMACAPSNRIERVRTLIDAGYERIGSEAGAWDTLTVYRRKP